MLHMRLPQRRSQQLRDHGPVSHELTAQAVQRLKETLLRLQKVERPKIVSDLSHALTLGDFSENAEYQDAKARLSRIDGRIFGLQERIRNAIVIKTGSSDGVIRLGSTVDVNVGGKQRTYRILGAQEADPTRGNISYLSPLGSALIDKRAGDIAEYTTADGTSKTVEILAVR